MGLQFSGPATRMDDRSIEEAARSIGCDIAAVRSVIDVESRGGFYADGRPKLLFERHYFSRLTGGRFDASNSDISCRTAGGYRGGPGEYDRLERAIRLDRKAALRSASWGAFQIMGDNCKSAGFDDVEAFVEEMVAGEPQQLRAFVSFVKSARLDRHLCALDWKAFAKGYNGPGYKQNRYDEKLAAAYAFHSAGGPRVANPHPVLKAGDRGAPVEALQRALNIAADGKFGPGTLRAVIAFQQKHRLVSDGVVGGSTWAALDH
ncbi:MAG TPA: N-acetylmuramidase domain-containing protein [Sphingomicrobium sp.]|nr:N-acetylmuramidase domain-containing protein [Sphingomicrobium sp.]